MWINIEEVEIGWAIVVGWVVLIQRWVGGGRAAAEATGAASPSRDKANKRDNGIGGADTRGAFNWKCQINRG